MRPPLPATLSRPGNLGAAVPAALRAGADHADGSNLISEILRAFGLASRAAPWDNEESIREELFSIERLEQHAESLAAAQAVTARPTTGRSLAVQLRDNESVLLDAYRAIADSVGLA